MDIQKLRLFVLFMIVFSLGWVLNSVITNFVYYDSEKAVPLSFSPWISSPERQSPSDHIKEEQIHVYDDRIVLDITDATWASFTDTNSMDPYLDAESNSIEIKPKSVVDIEEGDIISYHSGITGDLVVHRVIRKGIDSNGTYFIVQGDNNPSRDPEKIRFNQVHGVLVGIIY